MSKDDTLGIVILLSIITIALFGGAKGVTVNNNISKTPEQQQWQIQQQLNEAERKTEELKKQVALEEANKNASVYKDIVDLSFVARSNDPKQEYAQIRVNTTKEPINITGWKLTSKSSGQTVTIPKGTYLFFTGTTNTEENIYLNSGDVVYLVTGISPNGASFKVNKCSGYLSQFQSFTPYLSTYCPQPRNEDLSSIPKTVNNDACLDYIDYFPSCRIQTETLPANWSYECTSFIYNKINYPSCVNTHKGDKDFYQKEWRVYLKRSEKIWKDRREEIILYDNNGKIVDTLTY
jgi:hypothetical protein